MCTDDLTQLMLVRVVHLLSGAHSPVLIMSAKWSCTTNDSGCMSRGGRAAKTPQRAEKIRSALLLQHEDPKLKHSELATLFTWSTTYRTTSPCRTREPHKPIRPKYKMANGVARFHVPNVVSAIEDVIGARRCYSRRSGLQKIRAQQEFQSIKPRLSGHETFHNILALLVTQRF